MRKRLHLPAAIVSALALCIILGWMIADRAAILRDGREVVLKTEPFDPRDLLRGQYVGLNYSISSLPMTLFPAGKDAARPEAGDTIYVKLAKGDGEYYDAVAVSLQRPKENGSDEVWIRGTLAFPGVAEVMDARADYGLERFYTPEAEAPEIEKRMRDGEVTDVVAAVAADGRAQIKALRQGTRTIYTEPLF